MSIEYNINRLYWHSRRGMLELDLILMPFVKEKFEALPEEDKARYVKLLEGEDQDLFGYFLKHKTPEDDDIKKIVGIILQEFL